jgi:hypothetical protein
LKIDESKFVITVDPHVGGLLHYLNEEEGFSLSVSDGLVREFHYTPSRDDQSLRCPRDVRRDFSSDLPAAVTNRLLDRLGEYANSVRTRQFDKVFELYLPELAGKLFPVRDKHEFARWAVQSEVFAETWIELVPIAVTETKDSRYGTVYSVSVTIRASEGGTIITSSRVIPAVMKNGEWYFLDVFRLAP